MSLFYSPPLCLLFFSSFSPHPALHNFLIEFLRPFFSPTPTPTPFSVIIPYFSQKYRNRYLHLSFLFFLVFFFSHFCLRISCFSMLFFLFFSLTQTDWIWGVQEIEQDIVDGEKGRKKKQTNKNKTKRNACAPLVETQPGNFRNTYSIEICGESVDLHPRRLPHIHTKTSRIPHSFNWPLFLKTQN